MACWLRKPFSRLCPVVCNILSVRLPSFKFAKWWSKRERDTTDQLRPVNSKQHFISSFIIMWFRCSLVFNFAFLFPDSKVYIFPLNHKKNQTLSVEQLLAKIQLASASFSAGEFHRLLALSNNPLQFTIIQLYIVTKYKYLKAQYGPTYLV